MKCKENREVEMEDKAQLKNGAYRVWGKCPICGTNVNTMMGKDKAEALQ
jgi:hypothetical protein